MKEYTGWLFDLYAHPKQGIVLVAGRGRSKTAFFYSAISNHILCWRSLSPFAPVMEVPEGETCTDSIAPSARDLHEGMKDVLEVNVLNPSLFDELFKEVNQLFPDLLYYDTDIPLILRYAAEFGVFPLGRCKVEVKQGWTISKITPLDTPWELDPKLARFAGIAYQTRCQSFPCRTKISIRSISISFKYRLSLDDPRKLLFSLNGILRQYDPDVILTSYGDTWLFSYLEEISKETGIPFQSQP